MERCPSFSFGSAADENFTGLHPCSWNAFLPVDEHHCTYAPRSRPYRGPIELDLDPQPNGGSRFSTLRSQLQYEHLLRLFFGPVTFLPVWLSKFRPYRWKLSCLRTNQISFHHPNHPESMQSSLLIPMPNRASRAHEDYSAVCLEWRRLEQKRQAMIA